MLFVLSKARPASDTVIFKLAAFVVGLNEMLANLFFA